MTTPHDPTTPSHLHLTPPSPPKESERFTDKLREAVKSSPEGPWGDVETPRPCARCHEQPMVKTAGNITAVRCRCSGGYGHSVKGAINYWNAHFAELLTPPVKSSPESDTALLESLPLCVHCHTKAEVVQAPAWGSLVGFRIMCATRCIGTYGKTLNEAVVRWYDLMTYGAGAAHTDGAYAACGTNPLRDKNGDPLVGTANPIEEPKDTVAERYVDGKWNTSVPYSDNPLTTLARALKLETHQAREFLRIACENAKLMDRKQKDYGPGNIAKFGAHGVMVRLSDKIERLINLSKSATPSATTPSATTPLNESVLDTWNDIANYGIIGRMCIEGTWEAPDATAPPTALGGATGGVK